MRDSHRYKIECLCCGRIMEVTSCRLSQKYCSTDCVSNAAALDEAEITRLARMGYSRRKISETLEIPYRTLHRKLQSSHLNTLFLGRGKYHSTDLFVINRAPEYEKKLLEASF